MTENNNPNKHSDFSPTNSEYENTSINSTNIVFDYKNKDSDKTNESGCNKSKSCDSKNANNTTIHDEKDTKSNTGGNENESTNGEETEIDSNQRNKNQTGNKVNESKNPEDTEDYSNQTEDKENETKNPEDTEDYSNQTGDKVNESKNPEDTEDYSNQTGNKVNESKNPEDTEDYSNQTGDKENESKNPEDTEDYSNQTGNKENESKNPEDTEDYSNQTGDKVNESKNPEGTEDYSNQRNKSETGGKENESVKVEKSISDYGKEKSIEANKNSSKVKQEKPLIPIGLPNLRSSCYLNSVLQILFSCDDFRDEMINYVGVNQHLKTEDNNFLFTCQLGHQMFYMVNNWEKMVEDNAKNLAEHFHHSMAGDDIHKCFLQILTRINSVIKEATSSKETPEKKYLTDEEQFMCFKKDNNGFIFDIFNGQLSFTIKCDTCGNIFSEKYQLFKSMPLQVSEESSEISVESCIKSYFEKSEIVDSEYKCCDDQIVSVSQFTHVPKYLFLYLVRGSYFIGGKKNNVFVKFQRGISIPTTKGEVPYKLISVIDHFGSNESGHYFVKTFCNSKWWLVNDMQVKQISWKEVPSKHSIGLFFKKGSCDEDDDDYVNDLEELDKKPLKSIIEILYECVDIRNSLIEYYMNETNQNTFLRICGEIMHILQQQKLNKALKLVQISQHIFSNFSEDLHGCYLQVLNKISDIAKRRGHSFVNCSNGDIRNENDASIPSDVPIGESLQKVFCEKCDNTIIEECQPLQSICIDVEKTDSLRNTIKQYFIKSKLEIECIRCRKEQQIFKSFSIISAPKYLFFYFNLSTREGNKLSFDEGFFLPTETGPKWYRILLFIHRFQGRYIITYCGEKKNIFNDNMCGKEKVSHNFRKFVIGFIAVNTELKDIEKKIKKENVTTSSGSTTLTTDELQISSIGGQFPVHMSVKPRVIEVPTNTESFIIVIEMILSHSDIRNHLFEFHKSDQIAKIDFDSRQDITIKDCVFIDNLCRMTKLVEEDIDTIVKVSEYVTKYIEQKSKRFDIYNNFNFFLEKIYCVTKSETENENSREKLDKSASNNRNQSFAHNLFYGQIYIKTFCDHCETVHHEQYEPINSLLLDLNMIQKNKEYINLEECLQMFFNERQINTNDKLKCCPDPIIKEIREITHSPEYLFICLNRESANGEVDKRFVATDDGIIVPVRDKKVLYQLCNVIDHSAYITLKCGPTDWWRIINQTVSHIHKDAIVTSDSCGFLFCKQNE